MDLSQYRASPAEEARTNDLLELMPLSGGSALDVGARDGHFSLLLAERFDKVFALDLSKPTIVHPRIVCLQGNAADLEFQDNSLDLVFCAEVLEHIPPELLPKVCGELERVCRGKLLVGVPYKQDSRVGRTTCITCTKKNPPWGHVNRFDEKRLARLFPRCAVERTSFVGQSEGQTNALSCLLMDWAGNPYGTYAQEEACIHCGRPLVPPPEPGVFQRVLARLAFWARRPTRILAKARPNWIHVLYRRQSGGSQPE